MSHSILPRPSRTARLAHPRVRARRRKGALSQVRPVPDPGAPLALVFLGLAGLVAVTRVIDLEPLIDGPRPIVIAAVAVALAMAILPLGLVLTGMRDLARGPLRAYTPDWYERLKRR